MGPRNAFLAVPWKNLISTDNRIAGKKVMSIFKSESYCPLVSQSSAPMCSIIHCGSCEWCPYLFVCCWSNGRKWYLPREGFQAEDGHNHAYVLGRPLWKLSLWQPEEQLGLCSVTKKQTKLFSVTWTNRDFTFLTKGEIQNVVGRPSSKPPPADICWYIIGKNRATCHFWL